MKKGLAFLGMGAAWILFSGLIGLNLSHPPSNFLKTEVPSPVLIFEAPTPEIPPSPFFSSLEERRRTNQLLATSA